MVGQKAAIIHAVVNTLGNRFVLGQDVAIMLLTVAELEKIKREFAADIQAGLIDYSKDRSNTAEVYAYGRSCVMNHLKKARELNGNSTQTVHTRKAKSTVNPINTDILTDELKELVNNLV